MEFEIALFDEFAAARMRRIDDRHLIPLGNAVDRIHQREKMRFIVDIFLTVCGNQDIFARCQIHALKYITCFDFVHMIAQNLAHRRTGHENRLAVDALAQQIAAGMLGVGEVDVGNMVDNLAVDHLGHIPVPAAVAGFHVENRNF